MLTTILFSDSSFFIVLRLCVAKRRDQNTTLDVFSCLSLASTTRETRTTKNQQKKKRTKEKTIEEQPRAKLIIALAVILNDDKREREREREEPGRRSEECGVFWRKFVM